MILLMIYLIVLLTDCCKRHSFSCFKLTLFTLFIIGDSIGANYFVFTGILCNSSIYSGDFYIIDGMFRASSLINALFQSTPQIVLQVYNNQQIDNWNLLTIISIGSSTLSLLYTCTKLAYSLDKISQYEIASVNYASRDIKINSIATAKKEFIIESQSDNQDEVYEDSDHHQLSL